MRRNVYIYRKRIRSTNLKKIVCLCYIFLSFCNPLTNVYLYAQQDSNTNRVLANPNINLNNQPIENISNTDGLIYVPQELNQVSLKASRDNVQVGEDIILSASLKFEDPSASYRFYLEDSEWRYNALNEFSIIFSQFNSVGSYHFGVEVKVAGLNELLRDTIRIEVDSIDINVHPTEIDIGEEVKFEVSFNSFAENTRFRFFYGNNIPPSDWNWLESSYIYELPGTYTVYAELGKFDGDDPYATYQSRKKLVKVNEPYEIELTSDKSSAEVGEEITFTAYSNTDRRDVKYLFFLGRATLTGSPRQNSIKHIFNEPNNYTVRVQLLSASNQLLASASTTIEIFEPAPLEDPFPDWLLYVLIGVGAALIGSASLKWYFKPNITLHPNIDPGRQSLSNDSDLSIELELRIKFELLNSKYHIDTQDEKLIISIRRV